jgi:tetratricopeptide (TPR) repeat protein
MGGWGMPHDVFISYSSIDRHAAFAACATFEAAGIRCWIAPRDVAAGAEWAEEIIDAIETARIMVLIFSSSSNESRQVKREIELAVSRGLTIMPLRLEQIEPTRSMAYYMAGVHWIDALSPPLETHFRKMVEWIRPHLGAEPAAPKARAEPKPVDKGRPPPRPADRDAPGAGSIAEMSTMFRAALDLQKLGRHADAVLAYRALIEKFDFDPRPVCIEEIVRAYFNTGNSQSELGRFDTAIATFDIALSRAEDREEAGIRETTARILFNKAHALDKLNRKREAIAVYDDVLARYGADVDGMGRELAGRSLFTKAVLTAALGREDDAIALYDQYLARYGADPVQRPYVAEAMFNIGAAHGVKGRSAMAVGAYDRMLERFAEATEPEVSEFVAMALYNKGNRLSAMDKPAEAIASYDEVIARFGNDARMPERIAKAMINRANQLGIRRKKAEANAGYQAVIDKFAGSSNADVQLQVANARKWKS